MEKTFVILESIRAKFGNKTTVTTKACVICGIAQNVMVNLREISGVGAGRSHRAFQVKGSWNFRKCITQRDGKTAGMRILASPRGVWNFFTEETYADRALDIFFPSAKFSRAVRHTANFLSLAYRFTRLLTAITDSNSFPMPRCSRTEIKGMKTWFRAIFAIVRERKSSDCSSLLRFVGFRVNCQLYLTNEILISHLITPQYM